MTEPSMQRQTARRILAGPIGCWFAFALVHLILGWIDLYETVHLPFGDVVHVYRFWMDYAAQQGVLVGINTNWVYPVGALLPMALAYVFGSDQYGLVWLVMVTALDAAAFAALVRRRIGAAWWWLAFLGALGPVALARLDTVTVPIAIVALLWVSTRPVLAGVLLGLGAWIKVWPAALLAAAILVLRQRVALLAGGALASVAVLGGALLLGGGSHVFGFVAAQGNRGMQLEAPVSAFWLWEAVLRVNGSRIYYDREILTYQVFGEGSSVAASAMTPLLVAAVALLLLLALRALRRGVDPVELLVPLTLGVVLAMIVFNKVGSPQFVTWLAVPVLLGLCLQPAAIRVHAALALGAALLTQIIYPWTYRELVAADPLPASILTLRNLALVVLLALTVRTLWSLHGAAERRLADLTESALITEA